MRSRRIRFVVGTLGCGGAERQLLYQLEALRARGEDVAVLALTRGEHFEGAVRALGVPVSWVGRAERPPLRLLAIVRALRRDRPDVIQSTHFFTNLYAVAAARLLGCREVCALRGSTSAAVRNLGWWGRPSLVAPRLIAANSPQALREARGLGVPDGRLHLLPNVVDTDRFRPHASRADAAARTFTILSVGRLVPVKRMDRLLEAAARLRPALDARLRVRIAGAGPARDDLARRANALGLADAVELVGPVDDAALLHAGADVFALASDHEGTPNVVLEAMASGLPVVATRVGGIPDLLVPSRGGVVHDPEDVDGFARSLLRLAREPDLRARMGERGRRWAERRHAVARLPALLDDLYRRALA